MVPSVFRFFFLIIMLFFAMALTGCGGKGSHALRVPDQPAGELVPRKGGLTASDQAAAMTAWRYFERVTHAKTGLPEGAMGSPVINMWDVGSYLAALVCASRLDVLDRYAFDQRMARVLFWLNTMELNSEGVPNRFYDARSGGKIRGWDTPGDAGHSALEIGRLLLWLRIIRNGYIAHSEAVDRAVLRWHFRKLIDREGILYGSYPVEGEGLRYFREGRLGEVQYAAAGFAVWGFRVEGARSYRHVAQVTVDGILLPFDSRPPGSPPQYGAVTTRGIGFSGLELGWRVPIPGLGVADWEEDTALVEMAAIYYRVQEARFVGEGRITARNPHNLDRPPYYVLDSIYGDGKPFHTMTPSGEARPEDACVAVSAAFTLWALFATPYTDHLMTAVAQMQDAAGGWFTGYYESDGNPNRSMSLEDNATVLESLNFKAEGLLFRDRMLPGYWEKTLLCETFPEQGLPPERFQKEYLPLVPNPKGVPEVQ